MAEAGRPTDLTDELLAKIKESILDGNNLKETAKVCGIEENTLYRWSSDNYANLSDKIEGWRRDRKLILAHKNLEDILAIGAFEKDSLKVVADMTKFTLETLDKDNYSKRSELTGKDGKDLPTPILTYVPANNGDQKDNGANQTNTGTTGGDCCEQDSIGDIEPSAFGSE